MRNMPMVLSGVVALAFLIWFFVLVGYRVDKDSNKLFVNTSFAQGSHVFSASFHDPPSHEDFVFVYDPMTTFFDKYVANYARRNGRRNSGFVTDKGEVFPDDPSKRMISPARAAGAGRRYRQPRSSRNKEFVSNIGISFFYTPGDRSESENAMLLSQFQTLIATGQFMVKRDGKYVLKKRSSR